MATVKLTAKRQGTLPKELCEELHIGPGDELIVERRVIERETVWILRPRTMDWSWLGSVSVPANLSHDITDIRTSIAARRKRGD
jgi:bifunctional DNA-binding transcriptional regulator/antitoxin component of YhaV-PrlF toxin-antitoxin module